MDAQAPNRVFGEWAAAGRFLPGLTAIRPEFTWKDSRFDFLLEDEQGKYFVEVKGGTLEENGEARFPDAPTERGIKHLRGLRRVVEQGCRAAAGAGVRVSAYDCLATPESLTIDAPVPVVL